MTSHFLCSIVPLICAESQSESPSHLPSAPECLSAPALRDPYPRAANAPLLVYLLKRGAIKKSEETMWTAVGCYHRFPVPSPLGQGEWMEQLESLYFFGFFVVRFASLEGHSLSPAAVSAPLVQELSR